MSELSPCLFRRKREIWNLHRRDNTNVNNYSTSTIHKYLNETYYNTLPREDREKLGTKAVLEEFHGVTWPEGPFQLLYGWGTLNANVWLPSLSELVGITGTEHPTYGCYHSAMQGLNTSVNYYVDKKGGSQFAYFQQYNASGGGAKIWNACKQESTWLRSPVFAFPNRANSLYSAGGIGHDSVSGSRAVHPAVSMQVPYRSDWFSLQR